LFSYNIPEAQTVVRGTLRYAGFPEFVKVLVDIGFLSTEEQDFLKKPITWKEATQKILGASSSSESDLEWAVSSKTAFKNTDEKNQLVAGLKWREWLPLWRSSLSSFDIAAQLVSFPSPRLRQKGTHWTHYVLPLSKRWLTRRASVTWWYV
jgi:hypothetical protein